MCYGDLFLRQSFQELVSRECKSDTKDKYINKKRRNNVIISQGTGVKGIEIINANATKQYRQE